jgi:hypothetical protein
VAVSTLFCCRLPFSDILYVLPELKWKNELGREQTQVLLVEKLAFTQENPVDLNSVGGWITGHKLSPNANQYKGQLETPQSVTVDCVIRI